MTHTTERSQHWRGVYTTKADDQVSWFEDVPAISPELIAAAAPDAEAAIIDIGGGSSRLVDELQRRGYRDLTVLDISAEALARTRLRLGPQGESVRWIAEDITAFEPTRRYALWHDRAAFHFLTDPADQASYARVVAAALPAGATAIIATFALDGPEKCSGLPVARHDGKSVAAILGPGFLLRSEIRHEHRTPWDSVQRFQFSTFRRL